MPVEFVLQFQQERQLQDRSREAFRFHTSLPAVLLGGSSATHVVFGALVDGLDVALHLKDLWQSTTSITTPADDRKAASGACCLLFWSPALPVQEWGFSPTGARWATSPPPAGAAADTVSRTPSGGRSRSWNVRRELVP